MNFFSIKILIMKKKRYYHKTKTFLRENVTKNKKSIQNIGKRLAVKYLENIKYFSMKFLILIIK